MFKVKKRTEGKYKTDNSLKEFYTEYSRAADNRGRLSYTYSIYSDVIKEFNKLLIEKIISEAKTFKIPYNLGYLGIIKYDVNFDPENIKNWKVNYAESKKLGYIVYHDDKERYKWCWLKTGLKLKGKRFYKFLPSRDAQRAIAKYKSENPNMDYYGKLSFTEDGK